MAVKVKQNLKVLRVSIYLAHHVVVSDGDMEDVRGLDAWKKHWVVTRTNKYLYIYIYIYYI